MIKRCVNIILVGLNLEVNKDCGLKVGLVVENLGMSLDAHLAFIEDILRAHKLNFA